MRVVRVTWRATEPGLRLIHGEAGSGRSAGGRGMITDAVGGRKEGGLSRLGVSTRIAFRTKRSTELLES